LARSKNGWKKNFVQFIFCSKILKNKSEKYLRNKNKQEKEKAKKPETEENCKKSNQNNRS
jgi:hypothetical protein